MDVQYYTDMESRYRKQADIEPAKRERHIADADAWRRLASTAKLVAVKHAEMRSWIANVRQVVAIDPAPTSPRI
jgi:hypothetical protein